MPTCDENRAGQLLIKHHSSAGQVNSCPQWHVKNSWLPCNSNLTIWRLSNISGMGASLVEYHRLSNGLFAETYWSSSGGFEAEVRGEGRGAEFILFKVVFISSYTQWISSWYFHAWTQCILNTALVTLFCSPFPQLIPFSFLFLPPSFFLSLIFFSLSLSLI